jgi:hypothetical protein
MPVELGKEQITLQAADSPNDSCRGWLGCIGYTYVPSCSKMGDKGCAQEECVLHHHSVRGAAPLICVTSIIGMNDASCLPIG